MLRSFTAMRTRIISAENVGEAIARLRPFGVDVSSGIETGGYKDRKKMTAFAAAVREEK